MGCGQSLSDISNPVAQHLTAGPVIGKGGFASIRVTTYGPEKLQLASKEINIKAVYQRSNGLDSLRDELRTLKCVSPHQYITNLHFAYTDYVKCTLVLDLCTGGDLRFHIGNVHNFTESGVAFITACIGSALHHIHTCGVLHRDVKPENIIFDNHGIPKLTDFGVAYYCKNPCDIVCCSSSGTMRYLAPEVLTSGHKHSFESDFWSLGAVMIELLTLQRAFKKHCPREMVQFSHVEYRYMWESLERRCANYVLNGEIENWDDYDEEAADHVLHRSGSTDRLPVRIRTSSELVQDFQVTILSSNSSGHGGDSNSGGGLSRERGTNTTKFNHVIRDEDTFDEAAASGGMQVRPRSSEANYTVGLTSFTINPPLLTAYKAYLSEDCRDIIRGLMDVRVPSRLGVGPSNYKAFANHPFFERNNVNYLQIDTGRAQETSARMASSVTPVGSVRGHGDSGRYSTSQHAVTVPPMIHGITSDVIKSPFKNIASDKGVFDEVKRRSEPIAASLQAAENSDRKSFLALGESRKAQRRSGQQSSDHKPSTAPSPTASQKHRGNKTAPDLDPMDEALLDVLDNYSFTLAAHELYLEQRRRKGKNLKKKKKDSTFMGVQNNRVVQDPPIGAPVLPVDGVAPAHQRIHHIQVMEPMKPKHGETGGGDGNDRDPHKHGDGGGRGDSSRGSAHSNTVNLSMSGARGPSTILNTSDPIEVGA